jgi:large subunit ribosomal protein L6
MSRIGKQPVELPAGVKASVIGQLIRVEGPKGKLEQKFSSNISVAQDGNVLVVKPLKDSPQAKADYGTTRSLVNNMVLGVTNGWGRKLELVGVGFTAALQGQKLTLNTGYSHKVDIELPKEVKATVQKTSIEIESCDKQQVGELAAMIRNVCPPEPYLGKGIRYSGEVVRKKAGKSGK